MTAISTLGYKTCTTYRLPQTSTALTAPFSSLQIFLPNIIHPTGHLYCFLFSRFFLGWFTHSQVGSTPTHRSIYPLSLASKSSSNELFLYNNVVPHIYTRNRTTQPIYNPSTLSIAHLSVLVGIQREVFKFECVSYFWSERCAIGK